jgi:hypothetical protein
MPFGIIPESRSSCPGFPNRARNSGIRKQDIQLALLGRDRLIELVKVIFGSQRPL